jgi:hypothetical protein
VGSPTPLATITAPFFLGDELGNVSVKRMSQSVVETCGILCSLCHNNVPTIPGDGVGNGPAENVSQSGNERSNRTRRPYNISESLKFPLLIPCTIPGPAVVHRRDRLWTGF